MWLLFSSDTTETQRQVSQLMQKQRGEKLFVETIEYNCNSINTKENPTTNDCLRFRFVLTHQNTTHGKGFSWDHARRVQPGWVRLHRLCLPRRSEHFSLRLLRSLPEPTPQRRHCPEVGDFILLCRRQPIRRGDRTTETGPGATPCTVPTPQTTATSTDCNGRGNRRNLFRRFCCTCPSRCGINRVKKC